MGAGWDVAGAVRSALRASGLSGRPACVHSSLASFGTLPGGPDALTDAFLDEGCTLLVPTFSWEAYAIDPPRHLRPKQNGWDYGPTEGRPPGREAFHPASLLIDADMGALPRAVVTRPGRERGDNPLVSFSAVGPLARDLVRNQTADDAFAPLEALAQSGGCVVLIGVDLRRMTLLHLAERRAGRLMFRRWALSHEGQATMVEVGSCSEGFGAFGSVVAPVVHDRMVGRSHWQIFPADVALELATATIQHDPRTTMCGNPSCLRCQDAVQGGPLLG